MGRAAPKELREPRRAFWEGEMLRLCMYFEASEMEERVAGISMAPSPLSGMGMVFPGEPPYVLEGILLKWRGALGERWNVGLVGERRVGLVGAFPKSASSNIGMLRAGVYSECNNRPGR